MLGFEWSLLAIVALAFIAGGAVKGVVGMGLPAVAVAILGLALGPPEALPLLVVPAFVTNLWQAVVGGYLLALLRRFWPMLLACALGTWLGVTLFVSADVKLLNVALGTPLAVYGVLSLAKFHMRVPARIAWPLQIPVGAASGFLAGLTGAVVVPVVFYLDALKLEKNEFIQALGLIFATAMLALGAALTGQNAFSGPQFLLSSLAMVPAGIGMLLGQMVRATVPPEQFRRVVFVALVLVGIGMIAKAL